KPRYCLLVFGPEAKTRVWLVLDGDVLYVDRNGNGDLTEAGERMAVKEGPRFEIGEVTGGDGKPVRFLTAKAAKDSSGRWEITAIQTRSRMEHINYQITEGRFPFAERPQDAPVVPFDGSFTLTPRKDRGVVREPGGQWVRDKTVPVFHVLLGA